jgi:hypothetical protein
MEETPEKILKFYGSRARFKSVNSEMPISFVAFDGYFPVIKLTDVVRRGLNHFENTRSDHLRIHRSMKNRINLASGILAESFKTPKTRRVYDRNMVSAPTIMTGYLTALMIQERGEYTEDQFKIQGPRRFRLVNEIDVMVLGVYDMSKISELDSTIEGSYTKWRMMSVKPEHTKLLISEKLRDVKWMKRHYSTVIRKHLIDETARVAESYQIPQEVVSINEMKNYIRMRSTIQTNSLMEIMKIDQDIKDEVFQKINLEKLFV